MLAKKFESPGFPTFGYIVIYQRYKHGYKTKRRGPAPTDAEADCDKKKKLDRQKILKICAS